MAAPTSTLSKSWRATLLAAVSTLFVASWAHAEEQERVPTIEDAIAMSRIQLQATAEGTVAAFSPDGKRFAAVVWRGDLPRNVMSYSLQVFDVASGKGTRPAPRTVLTWDFTGVPENQEASAFEHVTFLADNRTIAFLGRKENSPRQVYCVDTDSAVLRQVTNHATEVRSFAMTSGCDSLFFSALADADEHVARQTKLDEDGVFLWDSRLWIPSDQRKALPLLTQRPRWVRQYFFQSREARKLIFDSRQSRPTSPLVTPKERDRGFSMQLHDEDVLRGRATLNADALGRHALMFPYALADQPIDASRYAYYRSAADAKLDAPYALMDFTTGVMQRLIDAPHPPLGEGNGPPVWSSDGRSVAIFTLLPPDTHPGSDAEPPQWVQVDIATRKVVPLKVPPRWRVLSWSASELVLYERALGFGTMTRDANGTWGQFRRSDEATRTNPMWTPAAHGTSAIGVRDSTYSPPELVNVDLKTGLTTTLTDLNPELRKRRYGQVETFNWSHRYDEQASGYLIKPIGFEKGRRYPLVVLLDDSTMKRTVDPYLLDGVYQLSGHALQMLAAEGFMVLYTREPRRLFDDSDGSMESQRITEHVETAVLKLEELELIDPTRVGLSGWSRAAYHTNVIMMRASRRFAAATIVDGGGVEYNPRFRPFTDEELNRVRTPLLFEAHGLPTLLGMTGIADRLTAMGKPSEVLYFASASHMTTRPQHRLRSLQTHVDWWRFWLMEREDADPEKVEQYRRWRQMRAGWQ